MAGDEDWACLQDGGAIAQADVHALKADGQLGADGPESSQGQGGGVMMQQQRGGQTPQLLSRLLLPDDPLLLQPATSLCESLLSPLHLKVLHAFEKDCFCQ